MLEGSGAKQRAEAGSPDRIHGYFETSEGREFLRQLYPHFVDRIPFGERKIASIIADQRPMDQDEELERTRSALRRWREGQTELWRKDSKKNTRLLRRLEIEMMQIAEIAELLSDRAATTRRTSFANALHIFFLGEQFSASSSRLPYKDIGGIYKERVVYFEDREIDPLPYLGAYCLYRKMDDRPLYLVHTFSIVAGPQGGEEIFASHCSGFAFVGVNGEVFRFLISHEDPAEREIDYLDPQIGETRALSEAKPGDFAYFKHMHFFFSKAARYSQRFTAGVFAASVILEKVDTDAGRFIDKHFSGIIWNIPL